jgi:TRAP-type transport system periplasmic protein
MQRFPTPPILFCLMTTLTLSTASTPASAADKVALKLATIAPEGSILTDELHAAGKEIVAATSGRVDLKIYPGGVMGNDSVVLKKMRTGQLHGGVFTAGGIAEVCPDFQIMSLPLLLRSYSEVDAVRAKIDQQIVDKCAALGYQSFGVIENGFVFMMSSRPIYGPDELKGLKIWIPEGDIVSRTMIEVAGVPPVPLPIPDVITGLQTGLVDTISASPVGVVVLQWFTKVKYILETPLLYSYGTLAVSQKAWELVPAGDRPIVTDIIKKHLSVVDKRERADNDAALATIKKQGIITTTLKPDSLARMLAISDQAIGRIMGSGKFDPALLAQIRAIVATTPK